MKFPFKIGDRVRIKQNAHPKSDAARLRPNAIGKITSLHGRTGSSEQYAVLDIFVLDRNVSGVYLSEIELVAEAHVGVRKWSLGLKSGNLIVVKCNTDAIKELAEIIGDDRLEYITGPKKV
jgi:hypothetical protein